MLFYPLWFSIAQSSAMSQFLCTVLCFSIVLRYRQHVNLKQCLLPIAFYFPIYFIASQCAISINIDRLKPVLGVFLILLSVFLLYGSDRIYIRQGVRSAMVCALLSAVVDAFFGIGGPTMVVYFMATISDKREYLGTIQSFFLVTSLYGTVMRIWKGQLTGNLIPLLLLAAVALLLGSWIGGKFVERIDASRMKKIVYGLIGIAGFITVVINLGT